MFITDTSRAPVWVVYVSDCIVLLDNCPSSNASSFIHLGCWNKGLGRKMFFNHELLVSESDYSLTAN